MTECLMCGSNQFDVIDGLYYCQICQTQAQDLREEEFDTEEDPTNFSMHLKINQPKVKEEKKPNVQDYGRPWQTHEGWTIILKKQVDALIQLGANKKLKDIVLKLWMLYLSKCGVAFNNSSTTAHPLSMNKHRDKVVPSVSKHTTGELTKRLKNARKKMKLMSTVKQENERKEKEKLMQSLCGEEFYEGDNPLAKNLRSSDSSSDESSSDDNANESEDTNFKAEENLPPQENVKTRYIHTAEKRHLHRNPQYMTGNKTLAFCYIGLMYVNELIAPYDLLRWVDTGQVPFKYNIAALFPVDMKFCPDDAESFRMNYQIHVPSVRTLRMESSILMCFLDLQGRRHVPFEMICSRYIEELKLPGIFHRLVRVFLKKVPFSLRPMKRTVVGQGLPRTIHEYELVAIGVIIVVLKLIFGLDGKTEISIRKFAMKLRKYFKLGDKLFVIEEWLNRMNYLIQDPQKNLLPKSIGDVSTQTDYQAVLNEFIDSNCAQSKVLNQRIANNCRVKNAITRNDEFKETVHGHFTTLLEKFQYQKEKQTQERSYVYEQSPKRKIPEFRESHPLISFLEESCHGSTNKTMNDPHMVITDDQLQSECSKDLSLDYILDIEYVANCSQVEMSDGESDEMDTTECVGAKKSLFLDINRFTQSEFVTSTQVLESDGGNTDNKFGNDSDSNLSDEIKRDLIQEAEQISSSRIYWYLPLEKEKRKPLCYNQLITICHVLIGCEVEDINNYVQRVEYMYLPSKELLNSRKKELRKTYLRSHFELPVNDKGEVDFAGINSGAYLDVSDRC